MYELTTLVQKQHKSIKHTFGKTSSKFANEKAIFFFVNVKYIDNFYMSMCVRTYLMTQCYSLMFILRFK